MVGNCLEHSDLVIVDTQNRLLTRRCPNCQKIKLLQLVQFLYVIFDFSDFKDINLSIFLEQSQVRRLKLLEPLEDKHAALGVRDKSFVKKFVKTSIGGVNNHIFAYAHSKTWLDICLRVPQIFNFAVLVDECRRA